MVSKREGNREIEREKREIEIVVEIE